MYLSILAINTTEYLEIPANPSKARLVRNNEYVAIYESLKMATRSSQLKYKGLMTLVMISDRVMFTRIQKYFVVLSSVI
ncbi:hypothetical protein EB796_000851 [Bugula neritina]|uniref:Uncharacterized protein n=1 Tax=Bugula neritina TaxID=10212 RepID=A0A7J7KRU7_BUGNE|nr:hypothetical protein EB796_000851 [Bugula neritina]